MTKKNPQDENLTTEENLPHDTDLESMLEDAQKKADEAHADFMPLLNKIKELETQIQEKEEIAKNSQIAYLHLKADFDILQRQTQQKIETADRDAVLKVVKALLPFIENLRKSLLTLSDEAKTSPMGQGLQMMYENLLKSLEKLKVKPIEAIGLEPNPEFHEPISMQTTEDKNLKGKIIQEFEQGFIYENEDEKLVISATKVIIGQ
ncbi:MAG: nucleotide exchange factor GrpE [candidate division SR1 bacterium]|nr:MAG: nucleotide exchange factor GrpE [candidate division SR1 bacterium]